MISGAGACVTARKSLSSSDQDTSDAPGSTGMTAVLGSMLAIVCIPLLVLAVRWLVVTARTYLRQRQELTAASAPFLPMDEGTRLGLPDIGPSINDDDWQSL